MQSLRWFIEVRNVFLQQCGMVGLLVTDDPTLVETPNMVHLTTMKQ